MSVVFFDSPKHGSIISDPRYVGFEIECVSRLPESARGYQRWERMQAIATVDIGNDSSLNHYGMEARTFPAQRHALERLVTAHTTQLKKSGFVVNRKCGLHTHLDARDFRDHPPLIVHLFQTVWAFENVLYGLITPCRKGNTFCSSIREKYGFSDLPDVDEDSLLEKLYKVNKSVWNNFMTSDPRHSSCPFGNVRYCGLNIQSIFYQGTIEFRYHQGTLDPQKMLMWAALLQAICTYAKDNFDKERIEKFLKIESLDKQFLEMMNIVGLAPHVRTFLLQRWSFLQKKQDHTISQKILKMIHVGPFDVVYADPEYDQVESDPETIDGTATIPF